MKMTAEEKNFLARNFKRKALNAGVEVVSNFGYPDVILIACYSV